MMKTSLNRSCLEAAQPPCLQPHSLLRQFPLKEGIISTSTLETINKQEILPTWKIQCHMCSLTKPSIQCFILFIFSRIIWFAILKRDIIIFLYVLFQLCFVFKLTSIFFLSIFNICFCYISYHKYCTY